MGLIDCGLLSLTIACKLHLFAKGWCSYNAIISAVSCSEYAASEGYRIMKRFYQVILVWIQLLLALNIRSKLL